MNKLLVQIEASRDPIATTTTNVFRDREYPRGLEEAVEEAVEDEQSAEAAKIENKNPTIQTSGERIGRALKESIIRLDLVLHEFLREKSMP